jgi:hypothetical protein
MYMDPKLSYVPTSLLNFVIRTVLYTMWCMLLRVAEQVRDGKSESHQKSIREQVDGVVRLGQGADWGDAGEALRGWQRGHRVSHGVV